MMTYYCNYAQIYFSGALNIVLFLESWKKYVRNLAKYNFSVSM